MLTIGEEIQIIAPLRAEHRQILSPEALAFLTKLQQTFNPVRLELLKARRARQRELDRGMRHPSWLKQIRSGGPIGRLPLHRLICRNAGSRLPVLSTAR